MTRWARPNVMLAASLALALAGTVAAPAMSAAQGYDATTVANLNFQVSQLQEQVRLLARQLEETNQQLRVLQQQMQQMNGGRSYPEQPGQPAQPGRSGSLNAPAGSHAPAVTGSIGTMAPTLRTQPQMPAMSESVSLEQLASSAVQDPTLDPARVAAGQRVASVSEGSSVRAAGPQVLGAIPVDPAESRAGTLPPDYAGPGQYASSQGGQSPVPYASAQEQRYAAPGLAGPHSGTGGGPIDLTRGLSASAGSGSLLPEPVERVPLGSESAAPMAPGQSAAVAQGSGAPAGPRGMDQKVAALPSPAASPDLLYEQSFDAYANKRYVEAEQGFKTFLQSYGSNELAGNAQYWLGQIYFEQGDYKQAAAAYLKGYQDYKKSRRAPDSLIGLALTLEKLEQKDKACAALNQVARAFPSAKESIKRATKESKRVGCG